MSGPEDHEAQSRETEDREITMKRLIYRANHRGTKEADLIIGPFVARNVATMSDAELADLERILDIPDVDLTDWIYGRKAPPADQASSVLDRLLSFKIGS